MKVERRDSSQEKRILTAMITDGTVLGRIAPHWKNDLFLAKWSNLIARWCVKFYERYEKAPGEQITPIFERWAETSEDENTTRLVERFLSGLSGDFENSKQSSSEYIIDLAATHFNRVRKRRLVEQIDADLNAGDDVRSDERLTEYSRIELGVGAGVDVIHDKAAVKAAFADSLENLVVYPDALKFFFDGILTRDALVACMGREKIGKSWWLQDIAWRGMQQKKRVAYFDAGDNSQNQVMRRFMVRASCRPWRPTKDDDPVKYPISLMVESKKRRADVEHKTRRFKTGLDFKTAWRSCKKVTGDLGDETFLKLSCHPNGTLGVGTIISVLDTWEQQDWVPDIVVIDYADLLTCDNTRLDPRHQSNEIWKSLRGLSQSRHCLVVTATQADAAAYDVETLTLKNFSNDKRKYSHVTAMFGINQTNAEYRLGLYRLNWLLGRELKLDPSKTCHVASCLSIANPAIRSIFS